MHSGNVAFGFLELIALLHNELNEYFCYIITRLDYALARYRYSPTPGNML